MNLFLSHLRLSRSPSASALAGVLMPENAALRRSVQHNLLWSVFADNPECERDFLWREEKDGSFFVLSSRAPLQTDLFEPHRIKPFSPAFSAGDRLDFLLRVNATRAKQGKRVDVVMDALHQISRSERASQRMKLADEEGRVWLERQGAISGFHLLESQAHDYSTETLPLYRGRKDRPHFGIIDLSGRLRVEKPDDFLAALARGFGRAKAFGCGLMLIRRTR
ncbi:type I-E CRISPR-associated protein Cas6/Cse3/CasE [Pseudochrobactrum sp. HB0163]|uniref:type I-E CRISPR-associated protein Cas6/Cse3/CasE n=1 Tax=Pseudochrobactrum sp. HB0163 TaxID=3450708 RepID=UPI003F6E3D49